MNKGKITDQETITETEEEIKLEAFCHTFQCWADTELPVTGFSYCGVPRCEQPEHGTGRPVGVSKGIYCPICGLKSCPKCETLLKGAI